jgi:hypothetical protein
MYVHLDVLLLLRCYRIFVKSNISILECQLYTYIYIYIYMLTSSDNTPIVTTLA